VTVSVLAAYSFSRYRFKGRKFLMSMFLTNNMFPTVLLLIPLYAIMRKIGILYTPSSLVLSYTTFTIPFSIWLLSGFLDDLPLSLEEAAMVDGANRAQAFLKIILPILMPHRGHRGIYFHEFLERVYLRGHVHQRSEQNNPRRPQKPHRPIRRRMGHAHGGGNNHHNSVCVMFFFAQKRLISGLTAGAVKG
jgi:multiple sugar transport system permease protein